MTCPGCNTQVSPDAVFCDNCGASLSAPPVAAIADAPPGVPCPMCGAAVAPGEEFCDNCGHALTPGPRPEAEGVGSERSVLTVAGASVVCAACGTSNPAVYSFCDACGVALVAQTYPAAPRPEAEPIGADAPPQADPRGSSASIVLAGGSHVFDLRAMQQALIGRLDPITGSVPEIDLLPHGGLEGGVGRQHARLTLADGGGWLIEDLNSVNATFINQQRLSPGTPYPLNDGDEIQVGRMRLYFRLVQG